MNKISQKYLVLFICLALALSTLAVFWQLRYNEFVSFDDNDYIVENDRVNAGLTLNGFVHAFTGNIVSHWHPLTVLSIMLDCQLYGLDAGGHHFTALLFHIANSILLFLVLRRMTGELWPGAFVAACFALHPAHVESVAWASERKDMLSTLFWLLTMLAYLRYVSRPRIKWYLLTLLLYTLGLMAKSMLVTLPFILLLLDYWPLGRFQRRKVAEDAGHACDSSTDFHLKKWPLLRYCILEKVPFFVLSFVFGLVIFILHRISGIMKSAAEFPFLYRIENAVVAYISYVGKLFWPARLAVFYPHLYQNLPTWRIVAAAVLLVCITAAVFWRIRRWPYLAFGWLWFLITLLPVIGLVQCGLHSMADRYTYISYTGLFIIIGWGARDLFTWLHCPRVVLFAAALIILSALGITAKAQLRHWRNSETLYTHAIAVVPNNAWAHGFLGEELARQNRFDEAFAHFTTAVEIEPGFHYIHSKWASVLAQQGKIDEALEHYNRTLRIKPDHVEAHNNLAVILASQGRYDEAVNHYVQALNLSPESAETHYNLANILKSQGKLAEAAEHYRQAIKLKPTLAEAHNNLGIMLAERGELDEAVSHYNEALQSRPDSIDIMVNLGKALEAQGKLDDAETLYRRSLKQRPGSAELHFELAELLQTQGKLKEAVNHYHKALDINPDYADVHANLGTILQLKGELDLAVAHYRRALQLEPNHTAANNNLAWILTTHPNLSMRDPDEAVALAERAAGLTEYQDVRVLNTLAAAYDALGRSNDAIDAAQKALDLAVAQQNTQLADFLAQKLRQYQQNPPDPNTPQ